MRWRRRIDPEVRVAKALASIMEDETSISLFVDYVKDITKDEVQAMYHKGYGDGITTGERLAKEKIINSLRRVQP